MRSVHVQPPEELGTRDGLAFALFLPDREPLGGVVVLHGAGSCKESHFDFARACRAAGIAAVAFDQRGHGASAGALGAGSADDVAAMAYPKGTVPTDTPVHPTPIYETLAMGLVAYALWTLRDVFRPGVLFAIYLALAGTERFLVEFLRRNHPGALGLTAPQWESLTMIAAGALWLWVAWRRGGLRKAPAAPATRPAAAHA